LSGTIDAGNAVLGNGWRRTPDNAGVKSRVERGFVSRASLVGPIATAPDCVASHLLTQIETLQKSPAEPYPVTEQYTSSRGWCVSVRQNEGVRCEEAMVVVAPHSPADSNGVGGGTVVRSMRAVWRHHSSREVMRSEAVRRPPVVAQDSRRSISRRARRQSVVVDPEAAVVPGSA
jgi:hypothetical protein